MISLIRRITAMLIFFQIFIFFIMVSFFLMNRNTKYRYQISEIEQALQSKKFMVNGVNHARSVKKRLKNNICLDSHGVYRPCDDDTYEKIIASDRKEQDIDNEDSKPKEISKSSIDHKDGQRKLEKLKNSDRIEEDTEPFRGDIEAALKQSSAMGNLKKRISSKVKNSDKRFVSDMRILFSNVYEEVDSVANVKLLVIVNSAAKKRARRDSIRATWWAQCPQDSNVRCFFFTDDINSPSLKSAKMELLKEKQKYKDLVFMPIDRGLKFGYRMLFQMQWSMANYNFEYLLRVDDDALVCLQHLIHDLQFFPKRSLQWGYLHCETYDVIYVDEGLTIFSRDLVKKFLSQNPLKMRCHAFGDQQVAIWMNDLDLEPEEVYLHDSRIHHHPPASKMKEYFYELDDMCRKHIIIHGVYPGDMEDFWEMSNRKKGYSEYKPLVFHDACEKPSAFLWYALGHPFKHQPKYCIKKPDWKGSSIIMKDGVFSGREGGYDQLQRNK